MPRGVAVVNASIAPAGAFHVVIATGQDDSKFGFTASSGLATAAVERAVASDSVELVGLHAHIGSQVFEVGAFARAIEVLIDFAAPFGLAELSVGGGLGVPYVEGESAPSITEWASGIRAVCEAAGVTASVSAEPGRAIVAAARSPCTRWEPSRRSPASAPTSRSTAG